MSDRPMDDDLLDQLRAVARDVLGSSATLERTRVADLGWLGLDVPEALGGSGATFAEVAVVLEELGAAAATSPSLGAVLASGALAAVEPSGARDELLRSVATGETAVAVALGAAADDVVARPSFALHAHGAGLRLDGRAAFVADGPDADDVLVLATAPDGTPVLVHLTAARLAIAPQPLLDETRAFGTIEAEGVEVDTDAVWRFAGPEADPQLVLDRAALAIACDSLGAARAMLDATVAYAGAREQFGRAIGSFQAVKHACADALVELTLARQLLGAAVDALVAAEAGTDPALALAASVAVSRAKAHTGAAAVDVVGTAMQLHGGIGYTWESGVHVHLKRVVLNRSLFGSPAAHRRRLGDRFLTADTARN